MPAAAKKSAPARRSTAKKTAAAKTTAAAKKTTEPAPVAPPDVTPPPASAKESKSFVRKAESYGNQIAAVADKAQRDLAKLADDYADVAAAGTGAPGHEGTAYELRRLPEGLADADRILGQLLGLGQSLANEAGLIG